jgi:hypothetical protein
MTSIYNLRYQVKFKTLHPSNCNEYQHNNYEMKNKENLEI